jgi:ABC-2 type transport system permease protein/lipopolysaccharide transport system permease protein
MSNPSSTSQRSQSWWAAQAGYLSSRANRRKALADLGDGWRRRDLWTTLGLHDIKQRYRRSMLGPFWITISMGIMIAALGTLYSQIFQVEINEYLPYLAAGLFSWALIANIINDSCQVFIGGEHLIKQLSAPLSIYVYRMLWSNLLLAAHNVWVYVITAMLFSVEVNWATLLFLPALALLVLNGIWIGLFLGLFSVRFRDVPMTVQSITQVMFFITPIFWRPDMLPGRALLLDANPFYHFITILRAPLLGQVPPLEHWLAVLMTALVGWGIAFLLYSAYRWRIAYWV